MITSKPDIIKWLAEHTNLADSHYTITGHTVNAPDAVVEITGVTTGKLDVQFGVVKEFHMYAENNSSWNKPFTSFIGCPSETKGSCFLSGNHTTSLEGIPSIIGRNLFLNSSPHLTDLSTLSNVKRIGNKLYLSNTKVKRGLIAALRVEDLRNIVDHTNDLKAPLEIINKWLAQPRSNANFFKCQDELLEADFDDLADI